MKTWFVNYHRWLIGAVLSVMMCPAAAQTSLTADRADDYVDISVDVANNHLWRGIEVSDGLVLCADLALHDKGRHVKAGLWGGTNTSGDYKEFNFFGEVCVGGWKLSLWDTYNFSPGADYNNREFFNYSAHTTGRFLDCILSYSMGHDLPSLPLTLSWSTILFGRDRWADNSANRYSTYVSAGLTVYRDACWQFDLGLGGAFTLASHNGDASTFYAHKAGIVHCELRALRQVAITKTYTLPVYVSTVFNPIENRAFFQIGATVARF